MPKFFLILSFLLFGQLLSAQDFTTRKTTTPKALKFYKSGRQAASAEDTNRAIKFFSKALKEDPNFIDARINIANLKYDDKDYERAKRIYKEILVTAPDYSANLYYNLAMVEWKMNEFEAAVKLFEVFLKKETKKNRRVDRAKIYIRDGEFAAWAIKNPVLFNPQRLSDNINTPAQEYLPTITADEESFIFTRNQKGDENFFFSKKTDEGWSVAQPLESINTPLNEGAQTLSADGKWFVFTACNRREGMGSCDLFSSQQLSNGQWTPAKNMGAPINSRGWESQPSLSPDGKTLFFTSDRAGKGGRDIWFSRRSSKGKWSEPKNIGAPINTKFDEQSPFFHPDGKTLYFMSQGHPGMGGDDLFLSRLQADGSWSQPENLGYPINTQSHEGALFIARDGRTAYFATDRMARETSSEEAEGNPFREANSRIDVDIFSFDLPEAARATPVTYVKAIVKDAFTKRPLQANAELTTLSTQKINYDDVTDKSGSFLVCLPMGENYALHVSKKGYLFHSENFQLEEAGSLAEPFVLEIYLEKIPENTATAKVESKPVILKNVFFATASAELRPESVSELMRLKKLLDDRPTIKIQLNGHTDDVGEEADNQQLSEARAKAVQDFLIEQGINSERLTFKGFGESRPIDSNETDVGRQKNRRTEFLIL